MTISTAHRRVPLASLNIRLPRPPAGEDPLAPPGSETQPPSFQHPLPLIKLPALNIPDVDETEEEQRMRLEDGALPPPPLAFDAAAALPTFEVAVLPPDDEALDGCADRVVPPLT